MFRLLGGRPVGGHALLVYRFLRRLEALRIDDDLIHVRATRSGHVAGRVSYGAG